MIGAIKRRWKSNKKCSDKDKEKVTPILPSFSPTSSSPIIRKGGPGLPPVDFIHVNSGRIELHPERTEGKGGGEKDNRWGQHLQLDTARHSWCGPQQMGVPDLNSRKNYSKKNNKEKEQQQQESNTKSKEKELAIIDKFSQRFTELEKLIKEKEIPNLEPVLNQLKEEFADSLGRQEKLVADLETLHLRVNTLETHNKALANIILPTLIRLTEEKKPRLLISSSDATTATSPSASASTSPRHSYPLPTVTAPPSSSSTEERNEDNNTNKKKMMRNVNQPSSIDKPLPLLSSPSKIASITAAHPSTTNQKSKVLTSPSRSKQQKSHSVPPPKSAESTTKHKTIECRIPLLRHPSTTHPPKNASSNGKTGGVKPNKSKLPVRKSSSSSNNSPLSSSVSSSFTKCNGSNNNRNNNNNTKPSLIIENKRVQNHSQLNSRKPINNNILLPPKDEGYSTMSNGTIDTGANPTGAVTTTTTTASCNSATFTRSKTKSSPDKARSPIRTGTWTKKTNNKLSLVSNENSENVPSSSSPEKVVDKSGSKTPSSSPSKLIQAPEGRTLATATLLEPATVTTMSKANVRIVRGLPHEIRFSTELGSSSLSSNQDNEDLSAHTVLWEDSDDSDILFLPIEVSSSSGGSESTLVPYNHRSSTASYNGGGTLDSTTSSSSTYYTARGGTSASASASTSAAEESGVSNTNTPVPLRRPTNARNKSGNNNSTSSSSKWDSMENEEDLVQRWMRLDDMRRNVEGDTEEELQLWSWDWEGIMRSNNQAKGNNKDPKLVPAVPSSSETLDVIPASCQPDNDFWGTPKVAKKGKEDSSGSGSGSSGTWTKNKNRNKSKSSSPSKRNSSSYLEPNLEREEDTKEEEVVTIPPSTELDFTAEFYRLTTSGTEDKIIQTEETCSSSSTENTNTANNTSNNIHMQIEEEEEESDLFLQCKNCLEKMSKLISLQHHHEEDDEDRDRPRNHNEEDERLSSISEHVAKLLGTGGGGTNNTKEGKATKWLPVPKSSCEGNRIDVTLVSSTDSEGLTSPSME